jgi:hypothetical protein
MVLRKDKAKSMPTMGKRASSPIFSSAKRHRLSDSARLANVVTGSCLGGSLQVLSVETGAMYCFVEISKMRHLRSLRAWLLCNLEHAAVSRIFFPA